MPTVGPASVPLAVALFLTATAAGCGLTELREGDVGDAPQCAAARTWPDEYAALEDDLADAIAGLRDRGAMCGDVELKGVGDLLVVPELRCAARLDAARRVQDDDIDQQSTAVPSAFERVNLAGYDGIVRHQLIAADFYDASELFAAWVRSPEHCTAMLDKNLAHIGIGHSRTTDQSRAVFVVFTGEERD